MWWLLIGVIGLVLGGIGAWTTGAVRVFMRTLALPIVLIAVRIAFVRTAPPLSNWGLLFLDFLTLTVSAFVGDYLLGILLGRHGKDGFREDSVGH